MSKRIVTNPKVIKQISNVTHFYLYQTLLKSNHWQNAPKHGVDLRYWHRKWNFQCMEKESWACWLHHVNVVHIWLHQSHGLMIKLHVYMIIFVVHLGICITTDLVFPSSIDLKGRCKTQVCKLHSTWTLKKFGLSSPPILLISAVFIS
jgi:hypothetical protein